MSLTIPPLVSGGVITNYHCTSACAHCLYNCSPAREKDYMDREQAKRAFRAARAGGCRVVHVGGGEPFLDPSGLGAVLEAALEEGVAVEYVETNSAWFRDHDSAVALLESLKLRGLSMLLVSISPLHNERIPLARVQGVLGACRAAGVRVFPWVTGFLEDMERLDPSVPHSLAEYENRFGPDYLRSVLQRYWVHLGGRALETFRPLLPTHPLDGLLDSGGCAELCDTSHFHLDLFGNYVPGLCSGLAVDMDDLGAPLDPARYPLLTALHGTGVRGLLDLAADYDVGPTRREYLNKCDLCMDVRTGLVRAGYQASRELEPRGHYPA